MDNSLFMLFLDFVVEIQGMWHNRKENRVWYLKYVTVGLIETMEI